MVKLSLPRTQWTQKIEQIIKMEGEKKLIVKATTTGKKHKIRYEMWSMSQVQFRSILPEIAKAHISGVIFVG